MIHIIKRILETVVISSMVFIALDRTKHQLPADLRDAVNGTGAIAQVSAASLGEFKPTPVVPVVQKVKPASNRSEYVKDSEGDKDVFISEVYTGKQLAQKAMTEAIKNLEKTGKRILFAAVLKETAGGDFYVIRLNNNPSVSVLSGVTASNSNDEKYAKTVNTAAANIENTCREIWQ